MTESKRTLEELGEIKISSLSASEKMLRKSDTSDKKSECIMLSQFVVKYLIIITRVILNSTKIQHISRNFFCLSIPRRKWTAYCIPHSPPLSQLLAFRIATNL